MHPPLAATKLDADSLEAIAGDAPSAALPREQLVGAPLADVMVAVGMQPSKAAVRRMIKVCCWGGWRDEAVPPSAAVWLLGGCRGEEL